MNKQIKDRRGERFGRLTVESLAEPYVSPKGKKSTRWNCICDCGNTTTVLVDNLRNGSSNSCGCLNLENITKHGMSETPTYASWESMKRRCDDINHLNYDHYSQLGYCAEWGKFENFLKDMGERPEGMTLDRIDGARGYSKDNCRWATKTTQSHNRTIDHSTDFKGVHYYKANGKYQAYIAKDGVKLHLGYFNTPEEAARVRDTEALNLYGDCASLNYK
jgi:hypothetical protein